MKTYKMLKLLSINEFDVQKCSARFSSKEEYFQSLSNFVDESGPIVNGFNASMFKSNKIDTREFAAKITRLQEILAEIGAVGLTWSLENTNKYLKTGEVELYVDALNKVFVDIQRLREKLIKSEGGEVKSDDDTDTESDEQTIASSSWAKPAPARAQGQATTSVSGKPTQTVQREGFDMLYMLANNFEFAGAQQVCDTLLQFSYTPEIDSSLASVAAAINEFDQEKAEREAKKLLEMAAAEQERQNPVQIRILAIDDMPDVLRNLKSMLRGKYSVFGMTDYTSAFKFLSKNSTDLIILDIEMPEMDGFEMLKLFRMMPDYSDIPIVFLTSNSSIEYIRKAMELGANSFLKKPIEMQTLLNKLEKVLAEAKGRQKKTS